MNRFNSLFSSQSQTFPATRSLTSITNGDRQYHVTSVIPNNIISSNINANSPDSAFSQNSQLQTISLLTSSSSIPSNISSIDVSSKSCSSEFNHQVSLSLLDQVSDSNSIAPTTQQTSLTLQTPRLRLQPVRFRHSIGSPSLLQSTRFPECETLNESRQTCDLEALDQSSPSKCDSALLCGRVESNTTVQAQVDSSSSKNTTLSAFGEDEVTRFFEDRKNSDEGSEANHDLDNNAIIEIQDEQNKLDLATAILLYRSGLKREKVVIMQRDQGQLWQILFPQKFDLSKVSLIVHFAGEAADDLGGPIREFLTLCMRRFPDLGFMVFRSSKRLYFMANAEAVLTVKYYKLGQIAALSILTVGR